MKIIYADDLKVANRASLYTPPIEESRHLLNHGIEQMNRLLVRTNSQLLHQAINYAQHYTSDEVLMNIRDIQNQTGFTHNSTTVLFQGDIDNLSDYNKEILFHTEIIQEAVQDNQLHGFGYKLHEPLHDTAIYQNMVGNQATPTHDCELFVDSSDYDFDNNDLLNINDMLDAALARILNDDDDITE